VDDPCGLCLHWGWERKNIYAFEFVNLLTILKSVFIFVNWKDGHVPTPSSSTTNNRRTHVCNVYVNERYYKDSNSVALRRMYQPVIKMIYKFCKNDYEIVGSLPVLWRLRYVPTLTTTMIYFILWTNILLKIFSRLVFLVFNIFE